VNEFLAYFVFVTMAVITNGIMGGYIAESNEDVRIKFVSRYAMRYVWFVCIRIANNFSS